VESQYILVLLGLVALGSFPGILRRVSSGFMAVLKAYDSILGWLKQRSKNPHADSADRALASAAYWALFVVPFTVVIAAVFAIMAYGFLVKTHLADPIH
jgi:hypothetical protein